MSERVWIDNYGCYEDEVVRNPTFREGTIQLPSGDIVWEHSGDPVHHPACNGFHYDKHGFLAKATICTTCKGDGIIDIGKPYPMLGSMWTNFKECEDCKGSGGETCDVCYEEWLHERSC